MRRRRLVTWDEILAKLQFIDLPQNIVYGVPKGGMIAAGFLVRASNTHNPSQANIILDDITDSGRTKQHYITLYPHAGFVSLFEQSSEWLTFPWEADHPGGEDNIQQNITRILQYIGEDPSREGLKDSPSRIVRSWTELFMGYEKNPKDVLTVFEPGGYDQIVLLKDIELFSTCEHHMLPFFGKAHVAYIPDKRVIGISKLARLIDIYARRLQIQERIGEQVTTALMEHLYPKGAACIIEAVHLCMRMRGCSKQHSIMVTSSVKGAFLDKSDARAELMELIK